MYTDGSYRQLNPDWHTGDSQWKASRIDALLDRNRIAYSSCVEVGCGAGQVVANLARLRPGPSYRGYDVSPDAISYWQRNPGDVEYHCADFQKGTDQYDLLLLIDVFEHVEDYMGFLKRLRSRAQWFVFHIPLELHVSAILRDRQLHSRQQVGHLHYFSSATALATLVDCGYAPICHELTPLALETRESRRPITGIANVLRQVIAAASVDFAARLLGGYSLLVLAKAQR